MARRRRLTGAGLFVASCAFLDGCGSSQDAAFDGAGGSSGPRGSAGGGIGGGAGGVSGAGATDAGVLDAGACFPDGDPATLEVTFTNSLGWRAYDYEGSATVGASSAEALELLVDDPAAARPGTGGADAGQAPLVWTIHSNHPLPVLPRGAVLWMSEFDDDRQPIIAQQPPPTGRGLSVRTREGGPLVVGSVSSVTAGDALALRGPVAECSTLASDACSGASIRITRYSYEVLADAPVRIRSGEVTEVSLGAIRYQLSLVASRTEQASPGTRACADFAGYPPGIWVSSVVLPKDPASIQVDLDAGAAPDAGQP